MLKGYIHENICRSVSDLGWGPQMEPEVFEGALYTGLGIIENILEGNINGKISSDVSLFHFSINFKCKK